MSFRTLLVTGGAGFIGSNFVHRTLAQCPGVRVLVMDAMTYAANELNLVDESGLPLDQAYPGRVEFFRGDVAEVADVHAAFDRLERLDVAGQDGDVPADQGNAVPAGSRVAVVHFAAESHNDNSLKDPGIFARTNVEGTVNLAQACAARGIHLHHISTDEVFGDLALDDPARFTPQTPYNPSSPYSASKASADHFVRAFVRSAGLSATISNCSNNYGPRQHPEKFIPRQVTGLIEGERPRLYGAGENVRDWIHVDDHNDAVWAILDAVSPPAPGQLGAERTPAPGHMGAESTPAPGQRTVAGRGETFLIGADGERNNLQVVGDILEIFGRPRTDFVHVTDRPGHDRRYAIDPSSIASLGWRPRYTDFRAGLEATVEWYRANPQWWERTRAASEEKYRKHEREL